MTLYESLGILPNATIEEIKSGYRSKAKLYHPDVNNGQVTKQWEEIQKAYYILSNQDTRYYYDESGYIREDDEEIERAIISFFREYIRNQLSIIKFNIEIDLVKDMNNYCNKIIIKNEQDIKQLYKKISRLDKLHNKFKRKIDIKKDFINIVIAEHKCELRESIQNRYKNIDIFKCIKSAVNNYEFDITKYLEGDNTNVSTIHTETN